MAKKYRIHTKQVRGVLFDKWLLKLEKKAFGWNYYGLETEDNPYLDKQDLSVRHKYVDWLEFRRITPYSSNPLFVLLEFLSNLWGTIRKIVVSIGGPLLIILLVLSLIMMGACDDTQTAQLGLEVCKYFVIIYAAGILLPSVIFMLAGLLTRKLFRIDEKLKQSLRDNGYKDDLEDCDTDDD